MPAPQSEEKDKLLLMLIEALRAAPVMQMEARLYIADLLDPASSNPLQLKLSRRRQGRAKGDMTDHIIPAFRVETLMERGESRQRAIHQVCEAFRISARTVETGMKHLADMRRLQAEFEASQTDLPTAK